MGIGFYFEQVGHSVPKLVLLETAIIVLAGASRFVFGGDIMLNGISPSPKTFAKMSFFTHGVDGVFGNLEIPLTNSRTRTTRKSRADLAKKDQWILKADPRHSKFLQSAGFTAVSLANNHAMDYGVIGLHEMVSLLDRAGIAHAGAANNADSAMAATEYSLKNGKRVALLSALGFQSTGALRKTTPATLSAPGIAVLNLGGMVGPAGRRKLASWIGTARKNVDFVIVAMHWGVERKPLPTPYQVALGRALIDAGADVVWGNHPHVLQGAEIYKGKLIMYSMGNLISSLPSKSGFITVTISENGAQSAEFTPSDVNGGLIWPLKPKAASNARSAMARLCHLLLMRYPSKYSSAAIVQLKGVVP